METVCTRLRYGRDGLTVRVAADVLQAPHGPAAKDPLKVARQALERPIGSASLAQLIRAKKPKTLAITISDITRPVPHADFLPAVLEVVRESGVADRDVLIIIGTGMHRPSTADERRIMLGEPILARYEVIDHRPRDPAALTQVSDGSDIAEGHPPVSVCKRFVEADFRIVTGLIEHHFMAGFSGGRKGVCPALVDLRTIQRFHGFKTLSHPRIGNGILGGNPCHEISLKVAKLVGVDFLVNVAVSGDRRMAGIYCGELEKAHEAGCEEVGRWTSAKVDEPYDLVVTSGGGYPLDETFYQTVKGMCAALPAIRQGGRMIIASRCGEGVGGASYTKLLLQYGSNWKAFNADAAASEVTKLDQWQVQMQAGVLQRLGVENLVLVADCDTIPLDLQRRMGVTPAGDAGASPEARLQGEIDRFVRERKGARVAIIPDGPYTAIR